jgi:hypothetical protein
MRRLTRHRRNQTESLPSHASAWAAGDFRDTLDNDNQRHKKGKIVSEPISPERFAVLVERAGLKLTPEQFEELRQAYPLVERMARTVRRPRDRSAEPAHIFVQPRV